MKTIFLGCILLGLAVFGLSGCDGGTNKNNSYPNNKAPNSNNTNNAAAAKTPSTTDADFYTKAGYAGIAEVELSKLALTKSQNAEIKKFAQKMVDDHTKAATALQDLATKKGKVLPADMDSSHKSTLEKLKGLSGADFDKAYVDAMVEDHEDAVDLFENESEDGTDADSKAFAAKTLPTLKSHLDAINGIKAKMK
jgi:putative membrane protein